MSIEGDNNYDNKKVSPKTNMWRKQQQKSIPYKMSILRCSKSSSNVFVYIVLRMPMFVAVSHKVAKFFEVVK